ncbi:Maltose permease MAL61 [Cercospora beticola]|uniref:Maltose permease MAL61 n=1 Tax=Cercospora beticola TaxID=122368 RepID=A0A2G5H7B9_CERBT|nr:Maltose permease MAL61 [Cercospora beticola]PIA88421.1 Maltose permease MAL61 [Cercospora beticola]WPB02732.1 hypothetical protein RHO25_007368 [Cercospora beticola]
MSEKKDHISSQVDEVDLSKTTTGELATAVHDATQGEHELSIREAIRQYKSALFWSLVMSTTVIMEGYDTNLLSNFFAYPSFLIRYGQWVGITPQTPVGYQLTAEWQAGLSQGGGAGSIIGCLLAGVIVSRYGSKKAVLGALIALSLAVFVVFFAPNLPVLVLGEVLCGLPWGMLATTAPAYASEILPTALRTYMTSYTNMCFILGQLISAGVLKGLSTRTDEWGYKIPFALQWVWPAFLIPLIYMAPESPWYLARMNRMDDALASLKRLQSKDSTMDPNKTLATIVYTNNLEKQLSVGTRYIDCFKGTELRRTEIACLCFAGQILCGICFAYNSSYFFSQVGLGTSATYSLALGGTGLAFVGCLVNWIFLMPNFGRRTIYVAGMGGMCFILILIGVLSVWTNTNDGVAMAQAVLTLGWTFIFQLSAGQLGWALPAEMGSTRLRQKTICLARDSSNIAGLIGGTLQQFMMNPQAWNLRGYTSFVWATTCFGMFVWSYFRLPETWNRTYHELDILFAKKVTARKFASTVADPFEIGSSDDLVAEASKEAAREAVRSGSVSVPKQEV